MSRILYFDIDGVLLDYDDRQRALLLNGRLEKLIKKCNFEKLVCVSGWNDIYNEPVMNLSLLRQKDSIHSLLDKIFIDKMWFLDRLELAYDTDHRGKHINLKDDWYYLDDWADKFFAKAHGATLFEKELNRRILQVDPHGDGQDILDWLDHVALQ